MGMISINYRMRRMELRRREFRTKSKEQKVRHSFAMAVVVHCRLVVAVEHCSWAMERRSSTMERYKLEPEQIAVEEGRNFEKEPTIAGGIERLECRV